MAPTDVLGVLPEHRRFEADGADHVVGHHQECPSLGPRVVFGDDRGQLGDGARLRVALQQQRQHRHEMALAAAETAVQVGAFAGAGVEGALDETQGLIEADDQLRGRHVGTQRIGRPLHPFGQAQDEVTLVHLSGDVEDVADEGHIEPLPRGRGGTVADLLASTLHHGGGTTQ
jgi:hypothetical protein